MHLCHQFADLICYIGGYLFDFLTTPIFYGSKAWEYLFGTKSIMIYKVIFVIVVLAGSTLDAKLAIDLSDTFNGLMAIPNLIGVICLSGLVLKITKNYTDRKFKNADIAPMYSAFEEIQKAQEAAED